MNRNEIIKYINGLSNYLKLSPLCEEYNRRYPENLIDYNNLRVVLKKRVTKRLSTEKLTAFYDFLTKDIFEKEFMMKRKEFFDDRIYEIVSKKTDEMKAEIAEALKHGF